MKRCTKCGVEKPFEAFGKDKYRQDGYVCQCRDCRLAYQRSKANPGRVRRTYWTPQEIEYLREHYPTTRASTIAKVLHRSPQSINVKAYKLGIESHWRDDEYWVPEEDAYLREWFGKVSSSQIGTHLGRERGSIVVRARTLNLVNEKRARPHYTINQDAFRILMPETAYVVGFILADGCLSPKINPCRLSITSEDIDILEKMRDALKGTNPITPYKSLSKGKSCNCSTLMICNKQIVTGLMHLGITPAKSLTATLPHIPDELFFHFLRGLFDGDGSVSIFKRGLTMTIASASPRLREQLSVKLSDLLGVRPASVTGISMRYFGSTALVIAQAMYKNANSLFLMRKYETFARFQPQRRAYRGCPEWQPLQPLPLS